MYYENECFQSHKSITHKALLNSEIKTKFQQHTHNIKNGSQSSQLFHLLQSKPCN